jgi:hypothetical protein
VLPGETQSSGTHIIDTETPEGFRAACAIAISDVTRSQAGLPTAEAGWERVTALAALIVLQIVTIRRVMAATSRATRGLNLRTPSRVNWKSVNSNARLLV